MPDLTKLIRRGRDLDAQVKLANEELKKIKAQLVLAGAGEHEGTDGAKALVSFPSPSIKPDEEAIAEVRRLVTPKQFEKLFTETVVLAPVKAFREVAAAIVKAEVLVDVIAACEKESSPQVRFS